MNLKEGKEWLDRLFILFKALIAIFLVKFPGESRNKIREVLLGALLVVALLVKLVAVSIERRQDGIAHRYGFFVVYATLDQLGNRVGYRKAKKQDAAIAALLVPVVVSIVFYYLPLSYGKSGKKDNDEVSSYSLLVLTTFFMMLSEYFDRIDHDPTPNLVHGPVVEIAGQQLRASTRLITSTAIPPIAGQCYLEMDLSDPGRLAGIQIDVQHPLARLGEAVAGI